MKKTTSPKVIKNSSKNGSGQRSLPATLSPAAAQAVLEDAVMEAAADIAAMSATLEERAGPLLTEPELVVVAIVPETPEEQALLELISVPLLGPARVRALADMGILTLDDLNAAPPEQIAGIKGVGASNAKRIKEWVAQQPRAETPPPSMPVPTVTPSSGPDPSLGDTNQAIFDALGDLDGATARLIERLGPPGQAKRLRRQLDKIGTVASELAEGPDVLTTDGVLQAIGLLDRVVDLLETAVAEKKLSEKRQDALCDALRSLRKSLQKALGQ